MSEYRWSSQWIAQPLDGGVRLSAGADLSFDAAVDQSLAHAVLEWQKAPGSRPERGESQSLFDQLVVIGALRPSAETGSTPDACNLHWLGEPDQGLVESLAGLGVEVTEEATTVAVRTTAPWLNALEDLKTLTPRHLVVDIANHHTVTLGPYAVVGETSCGGCLAGRVNNRWGHEIPPPQAAVRMRSGLIGAIISAELANIATGSSSLVNATATWDLSTMHTTRSTLLRLPSCVVCGEQPRLGAVDLPWVP